MFASVCHAIMSAQRQTAGNSARVRIPDATANCRRASRVRIAQGQPRPLKNPANSLKGSPRASERAVTTRNEDHGQGKVFTHEAALQHRHDWSRRPWQDVADGGDHEGSGGDGRRDVHGV